ncbi:MAG: electron transfer flavoprotein subunit alpha/FixB family protein [Planctomycetota bacterium]|jgi:electron transfer flavoprotein alpha subunit
MAGNVLVFVEQRSGRIHPASLQMFTLARRLASGSGGRVHAVVVGEDIGPLADVVARYGAQYIHLADDPALRLYLALPYTRAVCAAVEKVEPEIVLMATTAMTRDLAPRVAARIRGALATDCIDVAWADGGLHVQRPMYCAKCIGDFTLADDRVRILSVRPNMYAATTPVPDPGSPEASPVTEPLPVVLTDDDNRVKAIEVVQTGGSSKDVADADIIISGGRSLKSEENFKILYELAELLDGAVGASRGAVDAGYQPQSRQVGLTGKVVNPRLYVAVGIDGAIQHLAGMRGSKVIVAINTKSEAPIFSVASYGCVVDLFTLVPLLTEEFRRSNDGGG